MAVSELSCSEIWTCDDHDPTRTLSETNSALWKKLVVVTRLCLIRGDESFTMACRLCFPAVLRGWPYYVTLKMHRLQCRVGPILNSSDFWMLCSISDLFCKEIITQSKDKVVSSESKHRLNVGIHFLKRGYGHTQAWTSCISRTNDDIWISRFLFIR